MQVIDLFSGIGGFSLAADWMGWETVQFCEIDPFNRKVLQKNFPGVPLHDDIKTLTRSKIKKNGHWNPKEQTIITGGFPCQPFSVAGEQRGTDDDRHLWPEMLRIIREIRPAYVIGENVTGIISLALKEVRASLEAEGYWSEVFVIPACAVGADHRRDRVWIVAYPDSIRRIEGRQQNKRHKDNAEKREDIRCKVGGLGRQRIATNAYSERREECNTSAKSEKKGWVGRFNPERGTVANTYAQHGHGAGYGTGHEPQQQAAGILEMPDFRLTESPVCGSDDGLPSGLVRNRGKQLKAYGNAIVPQVAYQIFLAIDKIK